ncbi:hypothetical protein BA895_19240 [Humibacillus sp. DSM 29435]|nr:hypothetical protein BA895_19240 [Humibacillus sp. DSM 29435]
MRIGTLVSSERRAIRCPKATANIRFDSATRFGTSFDRDFVALMARVAAGCVVTMLMWVRASHASRAVSRL